MKKELIPSARKLLGKIEDGTAVVSVIGLGYVGLPLAMAFAEAGLRVVGVDVDSEKVDALNSLESYVSDVDSERLRKLPEGRFRAETDHTVLSECDAHIICVPTPLSKTRDPDVSCVLDASRSICKHLNPGTFVCLESTTYPGTTEELVLPLLEEGGLRVGQDVFLAFSPERIDPGRSDYTVENTPKVVGGVTAACMEIAQTLYGKPIRSVVAVSSTQTAEMVKLLENTFRAVNIALVNEVAIMSDRLGLDVWEIVEAASTKPYGFMKFTPGPGVGGHCIPLDPHYLSWKLKTLNYNARFIQLAGEVNSEMPLYWAEKIQDALNEVKKPVKGSQVLVLGVAYKKGVGDTRESPALDIIEILRAKGAVVRYHDPHVPSLSHDGLQLRCEPSLGPALRSADCVVIVTDHDEYDWEKIDGQVRVVVDCRNVLKLGRRKTVAQPVAL